MISSRRPWMNSFGCRTLPILRSERNGILDQRRDRKEGVVRLRDRQNRQVGGHQDHAGCRPLRGRVDGDAAAQRLAEQDDPAVALRRKPVERRKTVRQQSGLARRAGRARIAAIGNRQQADAACGQRLRQEAVVADPVGIAEEEKHRRLAGARPCCRAHAASRRPASGSRTFSPHSACADRLEGCAAPGKSSARCEKYIKRDKSQHSREPRSAAAISSEFGGAHGMSSVASPVRYPVLPRRRIRRAPG